MKQEFNLDDQISLCKDFADLLQSTLEQKLSVLEVTNLSDLYLLGLSLQFNSHLKAAIQLVILGFDSEAWILTRSMSELAIRAKWIKQNKSNAAWIILATEHKDLKRLKSQKARYKSKSKAIAVIQQRLALTLPQLPKNGRFWNPKKKSELRALPSTEQMAQKSGMLKVYRSWFKWGSDHTHSSHRVLERFMILDENCSCQGFSLNPNRSELLDVIFSVTCISGFFVNRLKIYGWLTDEQKFHSVTTKMQNLYPIKNQLNHAAAQGLEP